MSRPKFMLLYGGFRHRMSEAMPQIDYGWSENLKTVIEAGSTEIRDQLKLAEDKVADAIGTAARFRRSSSPMTILEKVAIHAVSSLYFVEKAIRALAGSTFRSKFLALFQKLTADSERIIAHKLGQSQIPRPLPMSQADGTGGLTVAILLTAASSSAIRRILPKGLELIPFEELGEIQTQIDHGKHPLMIGLGFNSDVRPVWKDRSFVKMNYLELTIGVPGVRLSSRFGNPRGPFCYIPSLLLNAVTPTLLGWAFGFRKRVKRIKADAYSYRVSDLISGAPLLTAEVNADSTGSLQLAANVSELAPWLAMLDRPIVTRTWLGNLKFTFFHWDWLFTPTSRAHVKLTFASDEIPLVPKGSSVFTSLAEPAAGELAGGAPVLGKAYLMSVPWRLLLPFGRKTLEHKFGWWSQIWRRI